MMVKLLETMSAQGLSFLGSSCLNSNVSATALHPKSLNGNEAD